LHTKVVWRTNLPPSHPNFEISDAYKEGYIPHNHYVTDSTKDGVAVMVTGPVSGLIRLNDGTIYNVTPDYIEVDPTHVDAINHHISRKHEELSNQLGDKAPMGAGYKAVGEDNT
jgi:hypothetical protein